MNFLISVPDNSVEDFTKMCAQMKIESLYVSNIPNVTNEELEKLRQKIQVKLCQRVDYLLQSHIISGFANNNIQVESGIDGDINHCGIDSWKLPRA